MTLLLTADVHFTDLARDEHRWGLFKWLGEQTRKHKCEAVIIAGDCTNQKDKHSSILVNRFVQEVRALDRICRVYILKGNHDYVDENHPFWNFLNDASFITEPFSAHFSCGEVFFLPSTKDYERDWDDIGWQRADYIFAHQTFNGARAENGTELKGIPPSYFGGYKGRIYSGDIHVPQIVSQRPRIEYIGSPYRIHFGDAFTPRCLLIGRNAKGEHWQEDLHFPTKGKHLVSFGAMEDGWRRAVSGINAGDQVKIRVSLNRAEMPEWPEYKKRAKAFAMDRGWELFGVEMVLLADKGSTPISDNSVVRKPQEIVRGYAKANKVGKPLLEFGTALLEEVQ